jgi:hypothetical protein
MIRANLLDDDGQDPRDFSAPVGIIAAAVIVLLCAVFVFIADNQTRNELEAVTTDNAELRSEIGQLKKERDELQAMTERKQEIESFISSLDASAHEQGVLRDSFDAIAPLLAGEPRRGSDRRRFRDEGWNDDWTISELETWELGFDNERWVLSGEGAALDDLTEILRRTGSADLFSNPGFERLTKTSEEGETYAFRWVAPLEFNGTEEEQ